MTTSDWLALSRFAGYLWIVFRWFRVAWRVWKQPGNGARHILLLTSAALLSWPICLGLGALAVISWDYVVREVWFVPMVANVLLVEMVSRRLDEHE